MKKQVVGALLVVLAVAGVLIYWQWGRGDDPAPTPEAEPASARTVPKPPARSTGESAPPQQPAGDVFRDDDPEGPLRLEGQVLDENDLPVGGAIVALDSTPPRTATTEPDGSFGFDKLLPRPYTLTARKDDLTGGPVVHELTGSSDPVAIRMTVGASLVVTVVARGGEPIAGAEVELRSNDSRTLATDSAGKATFRGVGSGFVTLAARAAGYGPARQPVQIPDKPGVTSDARIVLQPGARVAGRVVNDDGAGVAGARVVAVDASALFPLHDLRRDSVVTDGEGRFEIPALAAGTYRFAAVHEDHAPGSSDLIVLDGQNEKTDVTITVTAGGKLAGKVVDEGGAAVPFASVRVGAGGDAFGVMGVGGGTRQSTCDDHGEFIITGLPRAVIQLVATSDVASSEVVPADLRQESSREDLVVKLTISGIIAGVVVDSDGEPVAEAQVTAFPDLLAGGSAKDIALRGMAAETTDGGGRFELRGLPDGPYQLRASRSSVKMSQFMQAGVSARTGDKDVKLVIETPGRVVGKLAFDDGTAPEAFTVTVGGPPGVPFATSTGAFDVGDIAPGTYDVRFRGAGFAPKLVRKVVVEAGKPADMGTVEVQRGRAVAGRVVDKAGGPVAGATVLLARQIISDGNAISANLGGAMDEYTGAQRAQSDEAGNYRIIGVPPGELSVVAEHDDHGRSLPVVVPRGTADFTATLTLRPFGSVYGTVTAGDKPAAKAQIMATARSGGAQFTVVQTGDDGSYAIERLPEGPHRVTANVGSQLFGSTNSGGADVEVVGGQRVRADIEVEIGDVELVVTIAGKGGATIDAAQVFLFKGDLSPKNAKELTDMFTQASGSGGAMVTFAFGAAPATFTKVVPASYSLCVLPINGDLQDASFNARLQENLQHLKVYCEKKAIAPSPQKQTHDAVVPPMDPLPEPESGSQPGSGSP